MVGMGGFEPPTPDTPCQCATKLRYIPIYVSLIIYHEVATKKASLSVNNKEKVT